MNIVKAVIVMVLFSLMGIAGAHAAEQDASPEKAGGFFSQMDGAIRQFATTTDRQLAKSMTDAALSLANKSKPAALTIGGGLALVYLLYEMMQFLSGRTKSALVVLFDVGIPCIFAALFINQYATILPKFESLLEVIRTLGGENPVTSIMSMYGAVLTSVTQALEHAFGAVGGVVEAASDPKGWIIGVVDLVITALFVFVVLALILMGVAELLGLLLMGPFLFAVGVAFGPIMIAGIVSPWTRDYFTKWLQFLVISAGLTGVINVIFTLAAAIMNSLNVASYSSGEPTAVSLLIMAVLLLTINSMISQAPSIASALFPGHVGVAKSTGKEAKEAMKGANELGRRTTSGVANTATKSVRMTKGAVVKMGARFKKP